MTPDLAAHVAQESTKLVFDLPPQYLALGFVLLGLSVLVSLGAGVSSIWNNLRPRPSAADSLKELAHEQAGALKAFAEQVAETYATRESLAAFENRILSHCDCSQKNRRGELDAIRSDITSLRAMMTQGFQEMQRSLGRVEGKISNE